MNKSKPDKEYFKAILAGDIQKVREHLNTGGSIGLKDKYGMQLIHYAILQHSNNMLSLAFEKGADVNAKDNEGYTALHYAAQEYELDLGKRLIENGAVVDSTDSNGNTPLFRAVFASRGRLDMIKLLLAYKADKYKENLHGVTPKSLAETIANYDFNGVFD